VACLSHSIPLVPAHHGRWFRDTNVFYNSSIGVASAIVWLVLGNGNSGAGRNVVVDKFVNPETHTSIKNLSPSKVLAAPPTVNAVVWRLCLGSIKPPSTAPPRTVVVYIGFNRYNESA